MKRTAAAALAACLALGGSHAPPLPFAPAIAAFAAADRAVFPPACAVLFVGSSSIRFWGTLAADMAPIPVIRRGLAGSQAEHMVLHFDRIVAPYAPRAIVLYEGENDIAWGESAEEVGADVAAFMESKTAALGATPVYFVSIKPSKLRFPQRDEQRRANGLVAAMAAGRDDLVFVDVASAMLGEDGRPRDIYALDFLHMNADGYAIWSPIIRDALETAPASRAPHCG